MDDSFSVQKDAPLKLLNTFGIEAKANYFAIINTMDDLRKLIVHQILKACPKLILGEGSNILFTKNYQGLVIKNAIKGITLISEDDQYVWAKAGAGENWHDFVMHCVARGWGGVENLSLIPGTVGAAPIQNIGAYGAELKEIFYQLEAVDLNDGAYRIFSNEECQFGYRDSIFKKTLKHHFCITAVIFRLRKQPQFNTEYASLKNALQTLNENGMTLKTISDAVIQIRRSKLPDPKILGNAGSFFKNPIIASHQFERLQKKYLKIPHFIQKDDSIKVNAAWLIEQCGYKGKRFGNVGVYEKQALVLVNYGNGKATEVLELATKIQTSVLDQFEILLEQEVLSI